MHEDPDKAASTASTGARESIWDRAGAYIWTRWYWRYALGLLCIGAAILIANRPPHKTIPYFYDVAATAAVIYALICMKEIALLALALIALLYVGMVVAELPTSVAIIIGALIIAGALYARRPK